MSPLFNDPAQLLMLLGICSLRTAIAFAMLPIFAARMVPGLVRGALVAAVIFPVVAAHLGKPLPTDFTAMSLTLLLLREGAVGVCIGLGFGAFCAGLQTAGELIDYQTGLTFTQNIDPVHGNSTSITSHFLERLLFTTLMMSGFILLVIDTLYLSYELWPMGQPLPKFDLLIPFQLIGEGSRLFALALLLAGPVLLVLFIVDTSVGLLNRAAPQLGVFNIALSLKPIIGLGVLAAAMPIIVERTILVMFEVAALMKNLIFATVR
jgi:type III secretion protein T